MLAASLSPMRRELHATTAAAGVISTLPGTLQAAGGDSIRPFRVNVPESGLTELRRFRHNAMTLLITTLAAVAAGAVLATSAFAQSARDVRGASPFETIENEPAPKLIVDPPLPGPLAQGLFQAQYRTENVHIVPVFGEGALKASPRIGHLHITVDDHEFLWADSGNTNTVDIAGFSPGDHKVKIELVDANHNVFAGQSVTVPFTVPPKN